MQSDCGVVIVAAGSGSRMGGEGLPKQFRLLLERPVFLWSVRFFERFHFVREIVVVSPAQLIEHVEELCREQRIGKLSTVVSGGARRQDSVRAGVETLDKDSRIVLIHDAARPFPPGNLAEGVEQARQTGAVIYASPIVDTLKRTEETRIVATVSREGLWGAQTPQIFRRSLLERAMAFCDSHGLEVSDDASAVEALGEHVGIVAGSRTNLKLTTPDDWELAEAIASVLKRRDGTLHSRNLLPGSSDR